MCDLLDQVPCDDPCDVVRDALTEREVEQINCFEGQVLTMIENVLGIEFDGHNSDDDFQDYHCIMDIIVRIGERHGIPEYKIYPYIERKSD